jgi:hypothetical protein
MASVASRQERFRAEFRENIPEHYDGVWHAVQAASIGLVAIVVCICFIRAPLTLLEWLVIPAVIVGWNFVEWSVHKYVLHRPRKSKIARALYQRHTHQHHQFFTEEDFTFESSRDLKIVFFPVFALPAVLILSSPFALAAWIIVSLNAALLMLASVAAMYILFEVMHFCAHAPESRLLQHFPLVNTMRRHHAAHHDQKIMMDQNMNFTLPLFDWLMGTSDVKRGFLGTVFNGYSTRHVSSKKRASA